MAGPTSYQNERYNPPCRQFVVLGRRRVKKSTLPFVSERDQPPKIEELYDALCTGSPVTIS